MSATYESPEGRPNDSLAQKADRDPRELSRESDDIREDLEHTLNALHRKFSPRELLDRSLDFVQENGGDLLQKIGATVSKNPLPLLVTSAGLVWLFASTRSSSGRGYMRSTSPRSGDFDRAAQSFSGTVDRTESKLKQRANRTLDAVRSRASNTWDAARQRTHQYGDGINNFVSEQPLACGAIALAVGAVVGAAFPSSSYERDLVERARKAAEDAIDRNASGGAGQTESGASRGAASSSSSLSH